MKTEDRNVNIKIYSKILQKYIDAKNNIKKI